MFRNIFSKSIQPFNDFMRYTICYQQIGSIEDRREVNSYVKEFSLYLSRELSETCYKDNIGRREAIERLLKRWDEMKANEKIFYVIGSGEIGSNKSNKSQFPKTTRMINIKNTDPYRMVTQQTTQPLDDVTKIRRLQQLTFLNGYSVFTHHNYKTVLNKQPQVSSRKVFSNLATLWRNSTPEIRKQYKQYARMIKGRYIYSISGVVNFGEIFEEVLANSKTSGKILTEECESDDRDLGLEVVDS